MASTPVNRRTYTMKFSDLLMWGEFDKLAHRLGYSSSAALAQAAKEWAETHKDDPYPERVVSPRRRGKTLPPEKDPFA